ncbi:MAG: DUF2027 domain-containing protein [Paramuribaculum sp.]|nr:DUF2027 domain-containing protein [Paramuribaculum sp.]
MAKVGDTVRFLNSVGGGKIVKIDGKIAYVDEDGFETPVLLKDCVVIANGQYNDIPPEMPAVSSKEPRPSKEVKLEEELPIEEIPGGDKLNLLIAYESRDLLNLSKVAIDTFLVNDSNYYLYITYLVSENGKDWEARYAGLIEPNFQVLLDELNNENISGMDRISVQGIAFKKGKPFAVKQPFNVQTKFDGTKFFRRHCFKPNDYFDNDVIAIQLVKDDKPSSDISEENLKKLQETAAQPKKVDKIRKRPIIKKKNTSKISNDNILVVDLHINELLDNTNGMSNSEILNYQIDEFRNVMDKNLKNKGQKIVFIHGKGEGVLRNALIKELNHRYKNHDVQDASFREYGFGATQVTIR